MRQPTPTTIPAISAVPAARLTPSRHSLADAALCRTTSNSPAIARTPPNEKVNVAYAILKAPSSRGPTVLAMSRERRKLVALESNWSASAHPNRQIMLTADFPSTDKLSTDLAHPVERSLWTSHLDTVCAMRRRESRVVMPRRAAPGLRWI